MASYHHPQTMPLEERHLTAAQGYLDLGLFIEANDELEQMDADVRHLPEVLEVRLGIYRALEKWELVEVVARKLAQYDPQEPRWRIEWSHASKLRGNTDAARLILVDGIKLTSGSGELYFALACLEATAGNIGAAKEALHSAIKATPELKKRSLDEPALEKLWESM